MPPQRPYIIPNDRKANAPPSLGYLVQLPFPP
eukprot:COSAG02_NODE_76189_length_137_cov_24.368421_1_plen_31_part_10